MERALVICAIMLLATCGGHDTGEPCVLRLNVFDTNADIFVGNTVPVDLELAVQSGNCNLSNRNVLWESSNPNIAEIISADNTTAMVRARGRGSAYIKAWLALSPSTRDSTLLSIIIAVDTTQAASP